LIVALFPSQVLWSSLPLRDPTVWATVVGVALLLTLLARTTATPRLLLGGVAMGFLLYVLGHLRAYALTVSAIALVIAVLVMPSTRRVAVTVMVIALAVFVPMINSYGPLGSDLFNHDLSRIRAANAANAVSALELHNSDIAHLPHGLEASLADPVPWTSLRGNTVTAARVESPAWWLLVLASLTALSVLWRKRRVLAFPALYAAGVLVVLSLAEGNFGTLFRHRGDLVASLAILSAVGIEALWAQRHRAADPAGETVTAAGASASPVAGGSGDPGAPGPDAHGGREAAG